MTRNRLVRLIMIAVALILIVVLWDELNDLGAELYRFFN
jgi:hypothetical protein